jgi:hypothetical protein
MIARHQKFEDMHIVIDGCTFINCSFVRCTITFCGQLPVAITDNSFTDCRWQLDGAAKMTVQFLQSMSAGGGQPIVESLCPGLMLMDAPKRPN